MGQILLDLLSLVLMIYLVNVLCIPKKNVYLVAVDKVFNEFQSSQVG
jgi:hypothetical protein